MDSVDRMRQGGLITKEIELLASSLHGEISWLSFFYIKEGIKLDF